MLYSQAHLCAVTDAITFHCLTFKLGFANNKADMLLQLWRKYFVKWSHWLAYKTLHFQYLKLSGKGSAVQAAPSWPRYEVFG